MIPRYFTDEQLAVLERNAEYRKFGGVCPVCLGEGSHRYLGETYECPDDDYGHPQLRLCKLYWLHNIPLQYQQLVWSEFPHESIKKQVEKYVAGYNLLRLQGIGLTFYSKELGTGKSWAAAQVAKELAKLNYDVWWANFFEVKSYYEISDPDEKRFKIGQVQDSEVLVLDEVKAPSTAAQKRFYADTFEDLIRPRTNANFPTIITTNMEPDEIEETYPRVASLVNGKNIWVEMPGGDARAAGLVMMKQLELAANGETWPVG